MACVHWYSKKQTADSMHWNNDNFIFNNTKKHVDQSDFMHSVDDALCDAASGQKRFEILMEKIVGNNDKYRFVIQEPSVPRLAFRGFGFLQSYTRSLISFFRQ